MRLAAAAVASLMLLSTAACGGGSAGSGLAGAFLSESSPSARGKNKIKHVILMIQENRSFNDLFATFPGVEGATSGKMSNGQTINLTVAPLAEPCDFGHLYAGYIRDYDNGKMDGFDLSGGGPKCPGKAGSGPYQYVDPTQIKPYWDIAATYVIADRMFQTQGSGSYTAHQDLIRGNTTIDQDQTESLNDIPTAMPWGCDSKPGTTVPLLIWTGSGFGHHKGPFPCSDQFPSSGAYYATLRDLLDAKAVSWKYYSPPIKGGGLGGLWNAFDTIAPVRNGPEWTTNVTTSEKVIFDDISGGTLPAMSWLIPDEVNSDHPGPANDTGPSWVASVVNAVGTSSYWDSTAIVVVWDDWGGFYDPAPPPLFDHWGGLGFRVPMLVVSAYARTGKSSQGGFISHTRYEFGSILKFIENTFALGRLGTTDVRANSIINCFDFTQPARTFTPIGTTYSRRYFEHQPPSYLPVDTE